MADLNVNSGLTKKYDRSSRIVGGCKPFDNNYIDEQIDRINQMKMYNNPNNPNNKNNQFDPRMMGFNGPLQQPTQFNQFSTQPMMPQQFKPYDPYKGYLEKNGLVYDPFNHRRFISTFVDVNSKFRKKTPSLILDDPICLKLDPFKTKKNSNIIFVDHPDHPYEDGDLISIAGTVSKSLILRTYDTNGNAAFIIPKYSNIMKIFFKHGLSEDFVNKSVQVDIEGIKGDKSSFLGNIPINLINGTHYMYTSLPKQEFAEHDDFFDYDPCHFFIILSKTLTESYKLDSYNFKITIRSIGGIPLNYINANYPINHDHKQGYHIITNSTKQGYCFELPICAVQKARGGGNNVIVSKVVEVESGYPNPNNYVIQLQNTFSNVLFSRIVSSEFPNSEKVIKDYPPERVNNKLYWNNIDDGDHLYSVDIPSGNYGPRKLANIIETMINQVARISKVDGLNPYHYIITDINKHTDEVIFRAYKKFSLIRPFISVTPEIVSNPNLDTDQHPEYVITIKNKMHGMSCSGLNILISDAIDYWGIPAEKINGEHKVINIIDGDTYQIKLPRVNLNDKRVDTKGGANVNILIPDMIRMRFDQPNTMGNVLGFRNSGDKNSITPFSTMISNMNPYEFETNSDEFGINCNDKTSLDLTGDNYVLMVANPLVTLTSVTPTKAAFAKIQLFQVATKLLYNTFIQTSQLYEDQIREVSELEIKFYTPDGYLYDFNSLDHSFTIEIITVYDIPEGTGINPNTGQNYDLTLVQ